MEKMSEIQRPLKHNDGEDNIPVWTVDWTALRTQCPAHCSTAEHSGHQGECICRDKNKAKLVRNLCTCLQFIANVCFNIFYEPSDLNFHLFFLINVMSKQSSPL